MPGNIINDIASVDSLRNDSWLDTLGNKADNALAGPKADGASLYALAGFMAYYHAHNPSLIYPRDASPITVISGAGAWNEGSKVEIINNTVKNEAFDIHFINLATISAVDDYVLKLYQGEAGSEVFWGECSFSRDTNQMRAAFVPIQGPPIAKNTRISATLLSGTGGDRADVKIYTHEYPK